MHFNAVGLVADQANSPNVSRGVWSDKYNHKARKAKDMKTTSTLNPLKKGVAIGLAAGVLVAMAATSRAQLIYSQNFDTDDSANWVVLNGSQYPQAINAINFNFDYSTIGIPSAPHSVGGTTKGLKMMADINPATQLGSVTGAGLSASPTNFSITANFDMHVDMWVNYNGNNAGPGGANTTVGGTATNQFTTLTIPGSGSGSGIFYGCGYGTAGLAAQVAGTADSIYVGTCVDNSSSAEMRMYGPLQTGSYQSGVYQKSGTATPDPSGDIFVYNNITGTRTFANLPAPNTWTNFFPATKPPQAQINLYNQQTNIACFPGLIDFAWHDVEVQKIGNVIVYSIDGHIAATANSVSAGSPAGSYLTFLAFDINGNASLDPNFTNLNFVVFDNIRVSNYVNVVTVQATQPNASEIGPVAGTFTISRTSAGVPLTVNFTLTGTATNGVQYQTVPTSATFGATDTSINVTITPIDDGIPNLPTSVILTISSSPNYTGAGSDIILIADADTPTIDITASQPQMYERYPNDFIRYQLTRRGNVTADLTAALSSTGSTAIPGTDFVPTNNIDIPAGANYSSFQVFPVRNPAVTGNKTLTYSVVAGSGYNVGTAAANTATIVDSDYPPANVILNDALTDSSTPETAKWNITYGTGDPLGHANDNTVAFGFDLTTIPIPIPPSGNSTALHMTCNKANGAGANVGAPGGVNVYYTNQVLSGNYAVRFSMNLVEGASGFSAYQHEGALFGINHSGTLSNWWYSAGTNSGATYSSDGVWYFVSSQFGGNLLGDYQEFTGLGGTNGNPSYTRIAAGVAPNYTNVFKAPMPFTSLDDTLKQSGGVPANGPTSLGYDASTWSDVEIKQINNIVTLSINRTPIFTYTNTTVWKSGYLMLGYSDPYGDGETPESSVYYASLTVVQLTAPVITRIVDNGGSVTLTFLGSAGDAPSSFALQSCPTLSPASFTDVTPAPTITSLGSNVFQVTATKPGSQQFYRIRRN